MTIKMANDAWKAQDCETFSFQSYRSKNRISIQNYTMCSSFLMPIFFYTLGRFLLMRIPRPPIFNGTIGEDDEPNPDILYSALNSDTIVGEVLNNFTYPIESVRITASVYDKNGLLAATGETYTSDYQLKPGSRSGFDIYLDEKLPSNSKYTLTSTFEESEDDKPEALQ
jgi:hypothetical protein